MKDPAERLKRQPSQVGVDRNRVVLNVRKETAEEWLKKHIAAEIRNHKQREWAKKLYGPEPQPEIRINVPNIF